MSESLNILAAESEEEAELNDYIIIVKITDRLRKPQHLDFTDTKERVSWEEEVEAEQFESEEVASLAAEVQIDRIWNSDTSNYRGKPRYHVEVISCRKKLIQLPNRNKKLILPR